MGLRRGFFGTTFIRFSIDRNSFYIKGRNKSFLYRLIGTQCAIVGVMGLATSTSFAIGYLTSGLSIVLWRVNYGKVALPQKLYSCTRVPSTQRQRVRHS